MRHLSRQFSCSHDRQISRCCLKLGHDHLFLHVLHFVSHTNHTTTYMCEYNLYTYTHIIHVSVIRRAVMTFTYYSTNLFVAPLFNLKPNQAWISSITVLPSGCITWLTLKSFFSLSPYFTVNRVCLTHNNNNNNNYYYYYYLLQLGCYPVAVVILHVNKAWNWLLLNLSREGYMRSM